MTGQEGALYLVDGSSYIYRAFYAVRNLRTSRGLPTNAVYGFITMLNRLLKQEQPVHLAIALDSPGPTFRHGLSPQYKANRPPMPESLAIQLPYIDRIIAAYRIPALRVTGYEADDIIGTLSTWAARQGRKVVIVSGDKDLLQLVGERTRLWDSMKDIAFGPKEVEQRFGVTPSQLIELIGLAGDASDNIPGVPGIGLKTAQRLIRDFGDIEHVLSNLDRVPRDKERENLRAYAEQAILSRRLATLDCEVPLDKNWQRLLVGKADLDALVVLFRELEFRKLLHELEAESAAATRIAVQHRYRLVASTESLVETLSRMTSSESISVGAYISTRDVFRSELVGLALAWGPGEACYIPLSHTDDERSRHLSCHKVLEALAPLLTDHRVAKVSHNSKLARLSLNRKGLELAALRFDTMLAAYLLDPGRRTLDLSALAMEHLSVPLTSYEELVGTGKKQLSFAGLPLEKAANYAGAEADLCLRLVPVLEEKLISANLASLFHDIEMPLVRVLARMETDGVRVDVTELERLSDEFHARLKTDEQRIFDLAGESFNINSPQQLGTILFEKLGLPVSKKTKTGYSTDIEVLSSLAPHHPLPAEVLKFRSLMKLKSTYIDALPRLVNPQTGRIHTSYNQTVTVTGRLSSSEPNLQNIPARTEEGRAIRRAFVAAPGCQLLSADYSQIELRILAHYSGDQTLMDAFRRGEDIHQQTAAEIFGVELSEVNTEMRRQAKTINFGIIYGMSPFGLARELGIPQNAAREIIRRYFERYPGVRAYVERIPELARNQGFVNTLFNRKRFLPDLRSRNRTIRQFAERAAINTPIQGSAADIIKLAMIRIDAELEKRNLPARLIIQVHDELVLETAAEAVDEVASLVQGEMAAVVNIGVPLVVEVGHGANWDEAH